MENQVLYCGIDVSAETLDVCYQKRVGGFEHFQVCNSVKGFKELQKRIGLGFHFVMEATGVYHLDFSFFLADKKVVFSVLNALQIKRYIQMHLERNKSDKKDAKRICEYGIERKPIATQLPDNEYFECKSLNNSIQTLTEEITVFRNKIHAENRLPVRHQSVAKAYQKIIDEMEKELQKMEQLLAENLQKWQPELVENVGSVVGIGKRATAELIVYTQGFKNMENYRQLISYAGLSPKEFSSGSSIRGRVKICKQGGGRLRHILYMCAINAKKNNKACKTLYDRLVEKGKNKKLALIAVCNKLLKQVFAVVKNNTKFDNNFSQIIA